MEFLATILDTVLKMPKGFRITNFNGAAPDLGAFEFGGRDPGIVTAIRSGKVRESKAITLIKDEYTPWKLIRRFAPPHFPGKLPEWDAVGLRWETN